MLVIVPKIKEFIHGSMYYREATVPKGTLVVGCTHKKDGIAFLLKGSIKQIDGDKEYIITAPSVITTISGSQRYAYALEETIYSTVTSTESENIDNIEQEMYEEKSINTLVREDYNSMLLGYGLDDNLVKEDMEKHEVVKLESKYFQIEDSGISGKGLFTKKSIKAGTYIGDAISNGIKTTLGRYVNHSMYPNIYYNFNEDKIGVYTLYDLEKGTELTSDYRIPLNNIFGGN